MNSEPKKSKRSKIIVIMAILLVISIVVLWPLFRELYNKHRVKQYYFDNKQTFEDIVQTFKKIYYQGLYTAFYEDHYDYIALDVAYNPERYDSETDEYKLVSGSLKQLKEKYQKQSDGRVFSYVKACYDDDGKMLLYFYAKSLPSRDNQKSRSYELIYIDDDYKGTHSGLGIDRYNDTQGIDHKAFTGNWYVWSEDTYIG